MSADHIEYQGTTLTNIGTIPAKTFIFEKVIPIVTDNNINLGEIRELEMTFTRLNDKQTYAIAGWLASGTGWTGWEAGDVHYGVKLKNANGDILEEAYQLKPPIGCQDDCKSYTFNGVFDIKFEDIDSMDFIIKQGSWTRC